MQHQRRAFTIACTFGLALISFSAPSAQTSHSHEHPDAVVGAASSRPVLQSALALADSVLSGAAGRISTTADNQFLLELTPEDTTPANPFDLGGRTLVFTPDGHGGYSRAVQSVTWEDNLGLPVADREEVQLRSFQFDFAGQRWGSFFISRQGLITFGEPLSYSYLDSDNQWDTMSGIAAKFVTTPTISPLHKPLLDKWGDSGQMTVAQSPDRIVVTWVTRESEYHVFGDEPVRFQLVLGADGSIRFSYAHVPFHDGVVGLFPNPDPVRGDLLASVVDGTDSDLPGHLDLLDAAIYATNTDAVILEFTLRDSVPDPPDGEIYSYLLHFDTDQPYWSHPVDWSDEDLFWIVDVESGGESTLHGQGVMRLVPSGADNQIALLARLGADGPAFSATVFAEALHFDNDSFVQGNQSRTAFFEFNVGYESMVDLSLSDSAFSTKHTEIFHYRSPPDPLAIACRVIDTLGDEFDLFVFHSEFRVDSQESGTPVIAEYGNTRAEGTGSPWNSGVPCGGGRLKAVWQRPVWDAVLQRVRGVCARQQAFRRRAVAVCS